MRSQIKSVHAKIFSNTPPGSRYSTVINALDTRTVRGALSAPIFRYLRCQKKTTGVSKSSIPGSGGGPWLDSFCRDQPVLRAYPQDHPRSHPICNSRVSRHSYMATRQPGITPKYGLFSYILGLSSTRGSRRKSRGSRRRPPPMPCSGARLPPSRSRREQLRKSSRPCCWSSRR